MTIELIYNIVCGEDKALTSTVSSSGHRSPLLLGFSATIGIWALCANVFQIDVGIVLVSYQGIAVKRHSNVVQVHNSFRKLERHGIKLMASWSSKVSQNVLRVWVACRVGSGKRRL